MHETSFASTVLAALRDTPGPHGVVRVHVDEISEPAEDLAALLRVHLSSADPPVQVADLRVVPQPRTRVCASCTATWRTGDPGSSCPSCGGAPLPGPHRHPTHVAVEILPPVPDGDDPGRP